jgi:zinc/manganese transport system substrate-binding protein
VLRLLAILLPTALLFWATPAASGQGRPVVVTSFTVIQDWVQNIGKEGFTIVNLIPPRSEAHGYQLNPDNARQLRRADLIVAMNPSLEPWLQAWAQANGRANDILWLLPEEKVPGHRHEDENPHAWIDPVKVREMVTLLASRLAKVSAKEDVQANLAQYVKTIERVDAELGSLFAGLEPDQRRFIAHHANLNYFAHRYGLTVAGTILQSGSAESADPSARHFSELLSLLRKLHIKVVVTDAGQNDAFARRLTEDSGLRPPLPLSFEYLEPPGQPGDSWAGMMSLNGQRLHQALAAR